MHTRDKAMYRLIASQAAEWHVACSEGDLAPQQARAFMVWLRASPLHVAEFLRVTQIAKELADTARYDSTPLDALDTGASEPVPLRSTDCTGLKLRSLGAARLDRRSVRYRGASAPTHRLVRLAMRGAAVMLMLAVVTCGVLWGLRQTASRLNTQILATAHGQQRGFVLPDRTAVELDSDSAIAVRFDARERHVVVLRGQAYFKVAKDPARPFSVRVEHALVRDIGTAFDVYRHPSGSSVTVAEGRVQVWTVRQQQPRPAAWPRWFGRHTRPDGTLVASLGAGQQVQLTATGQVVSLGDADVQQALAWRHGQIAFDNQSIESVVAQFNRYNRTQIRVVDPKVGVLPISGVFDARDVSTFTAFLESLPDVVVVRRGQTVTVRAMAEPHHR